MKQLIRFIPPAFLIAFFCTGSCKCDEDRLPEDILMASSCWKITMVEDFNPSTNTWINTTSTSVEVCELDNCIQFHSDRTIRINEGATMCSPNGTQEFSGGTWSVATDGDQSDFTIKEAGEVYTGAIVELNDHKFVWETADTGFRSRITYTN